MSLREWEHNNNFQSSPPWSHNFMLELLKTKEHFLDIACGWVIREPFGDKTDYDKLLAISFC